MDIYRELYDLSYRYFPDMTREKMWKALFVEYEKLGLLPADSYKWKCPWCGNIAV